jgi:hypothetical protein
MAMFIVTAMKTSSYNITIINTPTFWEVKLPILLDYYKDFARFATPCSGQKSMNIYIYSSVCMLRR